LSKFKYDEMPDDIKGEIIQAVTKDTEMMKQNSEIEHLLNDITNRKIIPKLNYNPLNFSYESDNRQSMDRNSVNFKQLGNNKNDYNFVL